MSPYLHTIGGQLMRWFVSIGAVLVAGAMAGGDVASIAAPGLKLQPGQHLTDQRLTETADAVAAEILKTPIRRASRTSISGAIYFAMPLFDESPYKGLRRVIDISGDGPNNNGAPVMGARDEALSKGIVINGLPIMVKEPSYSTMDIDNLDWYYEDCVIGGPGSFVVSIKDREKFKEAIRTKLLLEVAGRTPERPVVPAAAKEPRVSCLIGEKIWQDRWGR